MKKAFLTSSLLLAMGLSVPAHAIDFGEPLAADQMKWAAGFQSSFTSYGFSAKYRYTDVLTLQGTIAPLGSATSYGARGLYNFHQDGPLTGYGFVGLSLWKIDLGFLGDDSAVGFGGGAGVEYEVAPRFLLSAELGFNSSGVLSSAIGLGLGIHYQF